MPACDNAIYANPVKKAERDTAIVSLRGDGKTYEQIGEILGYSKGRICQLINNDKDVKALIEEASKAQAAMLPISLKRHAEILTDPETSAKDALNAIKLTYINTGVSPTHTTPQVINNVLIQQQTILDPGLMQGFGQWFFNEGNALPCETVPDAEIVNDTSE